MSTISYSWFYGWFNNEWLANNWDVAEDPTTSWTED